MLVERFAKSRDCSANQRAIEITQDLAGDASAAFLQRDPSPWMIHETEGSGAIHAVIAPEFDSAEMLSILVPIVGGRHQAEWSAMRDRQGLIVQGIREQDIVGKQIHEWQAYAVAVLTA